MSANVQVEHYGSRLRAARQVARDGRPLSIEDATYEARQLLGHAVSIKTVERLETNPRPEDRASVALVVALCEVYGVPVHRISQVIAARASKEEALLRRNRARNKGPDGDGPAGVTSRETLVAA